MTEVSNAIRDLQLSPSTIYSRIRIQRMRNRQRRRGYKHVLTYFLLIFTLRCSTVLYKKFKYFPLTPDLCRYVLGKIKWRRCDLYGFECIIKCLLCPFACSKGIKNELGDNLFYYRIILCKWRYIHSDTVQTVVSCYTLQLVKSSYHSF